MEEAKRGRTDTEVRRQNQRQSDATSKETVEDLEESEGSSDSRSGALSDRPVPSPDGQPGETRDRADGSDKGGPM